MRQRAAAHQDHIHVLLVVMTAPAHPAEGLPCPGHDEDVHDRHEQEEEGRDKRTGNIAEILEGLEPGLERAGGQRHHGGHQHHDRGVSERKEKSDRDRPLALLHQLAHHVVNGRNMIGIHGVAQAEAVRQ